MYPKIKFLIDENRDMQTLEYLIKESRYGDHSIVDLAFLTFYPTLKKYIKKDRKRNNQFYINDINSIKSFVHEKYKENIALIRGNIRLREKAWANKKEKYFKMVNKLFEDKYWPKGKYIAYSTIWGVYPRFIEDKSFQIPTIRMDNDYTTSVIAHEMLHFIFYDYFLKKYPDYNMENDSFFIWNVSEAFNEVIQNHPKWIKEFKFGCDVYGGRETFIKKLQNKYYSSGKINAINLIKDIIEEVNKNKKVLLHD